GPPASLREALRAEGLRRSIASVFYTYVLRCADGKLYIGSASDLRRRVAQHQAGGVQATSYRLPLTLRRVAHKWVPDAVKNSSRPASDGLTCGDAYRRNRSTARCWYRTSDPLRVKQVLYH